MTTNSTRAPGAHPSDNGDAAIKAAWQRRQAAHAEYVALPFDDHPEYETLIVPQENSLMEVIDDAEEIIRSSLAITLEGVAIQLWTALYASITNRKDEAAITHGDLAALSAEEDRFDWNVRLLMAALRSVQSMTGHA